MKKNKNMRTLCKLHPDIGLTLCHRKMVTPGSKDVVIRVLKTGICGTDLQLYHYTPWAQATLQLPRVIGHEFVGEIAALGDQVSSFSVGDCVTAEAHTFCGHCEQCHADRRHYCPSVQGLGVHIDGAMADYVCIPERNIWPCPNQHTDIMAFADALGNAVYATSRCPIKGRSILITGAGPIGLSVLMLCRFLGSGPITIVDPIAYRVDLAKQLGATESICLTDDQRSHGFQFDHQWDIGFELSGKSSAFHALLDHLKPGSPAIIMGLIPDGCALNWPSIIFKNLSLHCLYGREIFNSWIHLRDFLLAGFDPLPLVTHHFLANDFQDAFLLMESGNCGKIILDWSD